MDEWFKLIVDALRQKDAHPDERRSAIVRAGKIAEAYAWCSESTLAEVFGSKGAPFVEPIPVDAQVSPQ